ncbi:MAG: HNH endonuclease [Pseudonocardiales bacterium]|nr:MAG: HNH endonuclease [Pseudonocardiales bacterium]
MAACLDQWRHAIIDGDDAGLLDQVRTIESVSRMVYSVMLDAVAELDSRNIAITGGFRDIKQLPAGMLNLSPTEAGTRVAHATQLAPRRTLGGAPLAPLLPNTAAALAAGEIGPGQVRVIAETMTSIPTTVGPADRNAAEAELARHAWSFNPTALHKIGLRILAHLDPDGPAPRDEPQPASAAGELRFWKRRDVRLGLEGYLEPEHSAAFRSLIEQLAAPRAAAEGIPDARTAPQRNADALLEVCGLARAAQDCPSTAGEPPHLTVTIDWDALRTGLGVATLDYGTQISAEQARRWACDAKIIPVVLGGKSEPLDVGRALRTVPLSIRRALVARDRGCAFPGCDRPPGMCQAHHRRNWVDGGETSVENCVLLCEAHHRHVHHTGWDILIHHGHVEFIPPAIIDPTRTPLHNPLRC